MTDVDVIDYVVRNDVDAVMEFSIDRPADGRSAVDAFVKEHQAQWYSVESQDSGDRLVVDLGA